MTAPVTLNRESLTAQVHQHLRRALASGAFRPGEKLKLRELSERLGVSLTPVREALVRLVTDGVLVQVDHRSVRVPVLDSAAYLELCEVRAMLEGLAAERAAQRATERDIETVAAAHARIVAARRRGDHAGVVLENQEFHMAACRIARMPTVERLVENLWLQTGPVVIWLGRRPLPYQPKRHPHVVLIESLRARDGVAARQAMEQDIMLNAQALAPLLDELRAAEEPAPPRKPAAAAAVAAGHEPAPDAV